MKKSDIAVIGLAVMGENLVLNMEEKGFIVSVYNRTSSKTAEFAGGMAKGKNIVAAYSLEELVSTLKPPRRVMLMIRAGSAVDETIGKLIPLLSKGDIIIDGGNSHFADTARRTRHLEEAGLLYIGVGVSGGEEGAKKGPSMMPGGSPAAWEYVKPIFQSICALAEGEPCCDWVGEGGAGHFVKMVHNGIEYGDMQLICEAYGMMKNVLGLGHEEMSQIFAAWNEGELESYLIEITRDILAFKDGGGEYLVEKILDTAGQKGTGKWAAAAALDEGVPLTLIGESVFSRFLSSKKEERLRVADIFSKKSTLPAPSLEEKKTQIENLKNALLVSKIISYAQGFSLMQSAAQTYGWTLDYGKIALLWRGGCIIRSPLLGKIKQAFDKDAGLFTLIADPYFAEKIQENAKSWRETVLLALRAEYPVPAFSSALSWYDGYKSKNLPANLLQAQRDYFGAHGYERADRPRGEFFHTDWTGEGGMTASTVYTV